MQYWYGKYSACVHDYLIQYIMVFTNSNNIWKLSRLGACCNTWTNFLSHRRWGRHKFSSSWYSLLPEEKNIMSIILPKRQKYYMLIVLTWRTYIMSIILQCIKPDGGSGGMTNTSPFHTSLAPGEIMPLRTEATCLRAVRDLLVAWKTVTCETNILFSFEKSLIHEFITMIFKWSLIKSYLKLWGNYDLVMPKWNFIKRCYNVAHGTLKVRTDRTREATRTESYT